jgi:peptidoglycan/LPS O-acetylase OafA/YrhL
MLHAFTIGLVNRILTYASIEMSIILKVMMCVCITLAESHIVAKYFEKPIAKRLQRSFNKR